MSDAPKTIVNEESSTPRRKGRVRRGIARFLSVLFIVTGGVLIWGVMVHPDKTEEVVYGAKTKVEARVDKVVENVTGEYPTILLEGSGGIYELDTAARDQYVHILAYDEVEGLPQTWGAHNGLGGSSLLEWNVGQRINIVGSGLDGVWVVVDYRDVDKFGTASQGSGLQGELALQTCHWGVPIVRFTGIVPLEIYEQGWPPKPQSGEVTLETDDKQDVALVVED